VRPTASPTGVDLVAVILKGGAGTALAAGAITPQAHP
jgi:hypothetical protein